MWYTWQRTACLWLSAFAIIFMSIAFCTPGWLILEWGNGDPTESSYFGLWYAVKCVQPQGMSENCDSFSYLKLKEYSTTDGFSMNDYVFDTMVQYEVEATLGLLACIVGVICVFIALTYWCESLYCCSIVYYMVSAAVAFLISGILVWIPTGAFVKINVDMKKAPGIKIGVPYSVILMAIAGILAFIIVLILIWMFCNHKQIHGAKNRRYSDSDYGDHHNNKYDDHHTRPYTIEKQYRHPHRQHGYPESDHSNHRNQYSDYRNHYSDHHKTTSEYQQNWMHDNRSPPRDRPFHYYDHARRHEHPSPYRCLSPYDRSLRY